MPPQSTALATVESGLVAKMDNIAKLLPEGYSAQRFAQQAVLAIQNNPALLACTPDSLVAGVLEAAGCGLDLSPSLGQAALVPRAGVAKFQPMVRGLITLIVGGGGAQAITGHVVYEGDQFVYDQANDKVERHIACGESDPKKITHAYARAVLPSGAVVFDVLTREKVLRARDASSSYQYAKKNNKPSASIWMSVNEDEMWRKTAVRHLAKSLPLKNTDATLRLSRALEADNADYEPGDPPAPIAQPRRKSDPPAPAAKTPKGKAAPEEASFTEGPTGTPAITVAEIDGPHTATGKKVPFWFVVLSTGEKFKCPDEASITEAKMSMDKGVCVDVTFAGTGDVRYISKLRALDGGIAPADVALFVAAVGDPVPNAKGGGKSYMVTFSDGQELRTFSSTVAGKAQEAMDAGAPVGIETKVAGQYVNLVSIKVYE